MILNNKLALLVFLFLTFAVLEVSADTLHLKNGESLEGLITKEEKGYIELNLGYGTVRFETEEIERIDKSSPEESARILQKWKEKKAGVELLEQQAREERNRLKAEVARQKAKEEEMERLKLDAQAKEIPIKKENGQIIVTAFLNNNIPVSLVLDTGASLVVLTKASAEKAGIGSIEKLNPLELQLADGRKVKAGQLVLKSVKVGGLQLDNVAAAVFLDDPAEASFKDGLLGMSFLGKFHFALDHEKGKLFLKKADEDKRNRD